VLDFRNTDLHAEDILDFNWLTRHSANGVKVTLLYNEKMEAKLIKLLRLNPEITSIKQKKVQYYVPGPEQAAFSRAKAGSMQVL
jgi:hypothetical protein